MCNAFYREFHVEHRKWNQFGMSRESAPKTGQKRDEDWDNLEDAFRLGEIMRAKKKMEHHKEQLVQSFNAREMQG